VTRGRWALVAVAAIAVLGGAAALGVWSLKDEPARGVLTASSVIDCWRAKDGGELCLEPDGNFRAARLPNAVFPGFPGNATSRDGSGTWQLVSAVSDPGGPPREIRLVFSQLTDTDGKSGQYVNVDHARNDILLYFFIGDPDLGHRYEMRRVVHS
jgi:hypothetical protein